MWTASSSNQTLSRFICATVDGMDKNRRAGDPQDAGAQEPPPAPLSLPWVSGGFAAVKGVVYSPAPSATMAAETGGALLAAIAKARGWIADLLAGRAAGFAHIARCEGKVERHVRFLAPLAFVSPQIVASIIDRSAPADLTVTALAKALPFSWTDQERRVARSDAGRSHRWPDGASANQRALPPPVHASNRSHTASNRVSGVLDTEIGIPPPETAGQMCPIGADSSRIPPAESGRATANIQ